MKERVVKKWRMCVFVKHSQSLRDVWLERRGISLKHVRCQGRWQVTLMKIVTIQYAIKNSDEIGVRDIDSRQDAH